MFLSTPATDTAEPIPPEPSQDLAPAQLCAVQEMIDAGLDLVRAFRREAQHAAAGEAVDLGALSRSYAQVTRAVRLTLAMQTRIANDTRKPSATPRLPQRLPRPHPRAARSDRGR